MLWYEAEVREMEIAWDRHPFLRDPYDLTKPVGEFADPFEGYLQRRHLFPYSQSLLRGLTENPALDAMRSMQVILAVGGSHPFRDSTEILSQHLAGKSVNHDMAIWGGEAQRSRYWRQIIQHYL